MAGGGGGVDVDLVACVLKAAVAVVLLVAGGAKLADLPGFAAAMRPLAPASLTPVAGRAAALGVALAELALGLASMSWPATRWLGLAVFALACVFVAVSALGYAFHRGRPCRCFGGLSRRRFDAGGIARNTGLAAAAAAAVTRVPPAMVAIGAPTRLALLAGGAVVAFAAFSAAQALSLARTAEPEGA